ncbi:MAG: 4Fe-4S dicluster domain-containing protein [Clostridia bacterium]|nr:4Fe-4S dicluster domain-containing protein [Clostridia bacterium]
MAKVTFVEDRCKGCGHCVEACPKKIVIIRKDVLNKNGYHPAGVLEMEKCIGCGSCYTMCPDCVITVER